MSNWRDRIIQNDIQACADTVLPEDFSAGILSAQILANKGWAPDMDGLIDRRIVDCPKCGGAGMNTCFGYWAFVCGAEILPDGEIDAPCGGLERTTP